MNTRTLKTFLALLFLCSISVDVYGQEPSAAIELPESNMLYRGYANKIIPAVSNNKGGVIFLTGENVLITKPDGRKYYTVRPLGRNRFVYISVNLIIGKDTSFVKKVKYRVSNLPDPSIYWGDIQQGRKANIQQKKIVAKYPAGIPLSNSFKIDNWEICIDSNCVSSTGNDLRKAESLLKKIKETSTVSIIVIFVGADEIRRKKVVSWEVDPWKEADSTTTPQ